MMPSANEDLIGPRLREVLRAIVVQHVATGEPVSSRSLSKNERFAVSSATIRNVMADLEDLGLLSHPHTSAGRVPTDSGYRFFIDNLMRSRRLSRVEKDAIDDEMSRAGELDEVLDVASRILSRISDQVGLVFLPTLTRMRMRSVDLIPVADKKVMCVIVGSNGVVVNRMIETTTRFQRDELEKIGNYLTREYEGRTLRQIRHELLELMKADRAKVDQLVKNVVMVGVGAVDEILPDHDLYLAGESSILNKPEFVADANAIRKTLHAFEEKEKLVEILNLCIDEEGLKILIGSENDFTSCYNFSLVASRYGSEHSPTGLVGIIGPTRMEYARVAPLVEYLGEVLGRRIEDEDDHGK